MITHKFLLIKKTPQHISYRDFDKNTMTTISDEFIQKNWGYFNSINVYWNNWGNLQKGLAYYAISILTPDMAKKVIDSMRQITIKDQDYNNLLALLEESVRKKENVIHFGI